ncbi:hypothetical protein JZ751_007555 [Albula glossodonta]|uniref:5' exonuclease Apollo n=1 Tax=Albula glossodonta TaxID=121402 RepID=A0A8T2N9W1_9TELE|nr:hypothetical protein JZ751_007555 [Albula glossodonta]
MTLALPLLQVCYHSHTGTNSQCAITLTLALTPMCYHSHTGTNSQCAITLTLALTPRDFRYTPAMLREPCLRTHTDIDVLYLDNTNCDPTRTLPSRQRATQQIKELIRSHPGHNVVIGLYSLGKEVLLVDLALEFRTWVEVSPERLETLQVLELPDVFTTEPGAGRIRAVDQSDLCASNLAAWNRLQPTLAILPTSRPTLTFHPSLYVVPYSDHSSYQELEDFVAALRPGSLVPILGAYAPCFSTLLSPRKKRRHLVVPESVRRYMAMPIGEDLRLQLEPAPYRLWPRHSAPRGVVFESPKSECKGATLSLEAPQETDSCEEPDDAAVEAASRVRLSFAFCRDGSPPGGAGVGVQERQSPLAISAEVEMTESLSLSQLTQTELQHAPEVQPKRITAVSLRPRNLQRPKSELSCFSRLCPRKTAPQTHCAKRDRNSFSSGESDSTDTASSKKSKPGTDTDSEDGCNPRMPQHLSERQPEAKDGSQSHDCEGTVQSVLDDPRSHDSESAVQSILEDLTFPDEEVAMGNTVWGHGFLEQYRFAPTNLPHQGAWSFHSALERLLTLCKQEGLRFQQPAVP